MTNDLEARLSKETIASAIREAKFQLEPADQFDKIAAIDVLLRYSRAFSINGDPATLTQVYLAGLTGIPRRALSEGLPSILDNWTDTFRLPTPGNIRELTKAMVLKWESELNGLMFAKHAMNIAPLEPPEVYDGDETAEFRRETENITKSTVAMLKAKSLEFNRTRRPRVGEQSMEVTYGPDPLQL